MCDSMCYSDYIEKVDYYKEHDNRELNFQTEL